MPMKSKSVTSLDVARAVGVSRSTVSRAFAQNTYVKPQVREEILRVSNKLGYTPNVFARALISQESPIVGIIMHTLSNPFHAELYSTLSRAMQAAGLTPLAAQLSETGDIKAALRAYRQYQVKRVVLTSFAISEGVLEACLNSGLEVVLLNRTDLKGRTSAICADLAQGGRLAADHLAARGYARIAILDGLAGSWTGRARSEGYLQGLATYGLEPVARFEGDYSYEAGLRAAATVQQRVGAIDAVLCANDLCAFGLMDGLRTAGMSIPGDIAVIGYDDVPMAAWGAYKLTSVRLPVRQMVERLIDVLNRSSQAEEPVTEVTFVPCRLVERTSG